MNTKQAQHLVLLQNLSDRLAWLECKTAGNGVQILGGGVQGLDSGDSEGLNIASPSFTTTLQKALNAISKQLHLGWFTKHEVIFIVPSHRLSARFIETPATDEDNIRDLVAFEVSEALQVPVERIAWDMLISSQHGREPEKHLFWVATRKEYVDTLLQNWPKNLLYPTQITAELWALYEFILSAEKSHLRDPAILVSREGDRATLTVANSKAVYFTRSITLTRPGIGQDSGSSDVAQAEILATEINRTLFYTRERFPQGSLRKIILVGFEGWDLSQLRAKAHEQDLEVNELDLAGVLTFFPPIQASLSQEHISLLCIAYNNLARGLPGMNLLLQEAKDGWRMHIPESSIPMPKFGMVAGTLAGLLLMLWVGKGMWLNQAAAQRAVEGQELLKLAEKLQREEIGLRELSRTDVKYADLYIYLSKTLPEDVLVKSISLDLKSGVELSFTGGNQQRIVDLINEMNKSPYFRDLSIERAVNESEGLAIYVKGKLKMG